MIRFLKNLFKHPGTWVLGSVVLVGVAVAVPVAAPALLVAAGVGMGAAGVSLPFYLERFRDNYAPGSLKKMFSVWAKAHPAQAVVLALTLALFLAALVLTIGFFTGGAGFAFMAPVFAAGAATTVGGVSLSAILASAFVMAPLTLGNNLKRFLGWLDSFKYDGLTESQENPGEWVSSARTDRAAGLAERGIGEYCTVVFTGMKKTVSNGLSSPDAELIDASQREPAHYL